MGFKIKAIANAALLIGLAGGQSRAEITITVTQVGANVDVTGSGSIDLTGLTPFNHAFGPLQISPDDGFLGVGGPATFEEYKGAAGPTSFGPGGNTPFTMQSGSVITYDANPGGTAGNLIGLPLGYVSGTPIMGAAEFANATISSLGLTPGTYTATWDGGGPDHTLTVQIGQATAVPEPSTAIVAVFGALVFQAYGWSRHRREQRRQAAA